MSIVPRLFELYRNQGISVVSGLNPNHWSGLRSAPFTWFLRDGKSCTTGMGIALQEVLFLECLFDRYKPERLFIIGNSLGWSTIAVALLNPQSHVVAMDAGVDLNSLEGLDLTNDIVRKAGLSVEAVRGTSPQDVQSVLARYFPASPDFIFIDGLHTNDQVVLDFHAVRAATPSESVFLFHDVHEFDLHRGLAQIAAESSLMLRKLMATTSGMALLYPPELAGVLTPVLDVFGPSDELLRVIEAQARLYAPRHIRWYRNVAKARNTLRRLMGKPAFRLP